MERSRHDREKASATRRMCILDGRIREIEAEKNALLQGLSERVASRPIGHKAAPPSAMRQSAGANGFRLKY
jgi:hypothetical protein